MPKSRLRVYVGPENETTASVLGHEPSDPATVKVPLGEILPALLEAAAAGRVWVDDFAEDEITLPTDLYEVILAYQHYRRPA